MTTIVHRRDDGTEVSASFSEFNKLKADRDGLREQAQRALDHFDLRSELYTNDADVAEGMASILRAALK